MQREGLSATDSIQIVVDGDCDECRNPADLNGDKIVDIEDFRIFGGQYLSEFGQPE